MIALLSKPEFIDFVANLERGVSTNYILRHVPDRPPDTGKLYLFWSETPSNKEKPDWPEAIIVNNEEIAEFLAWVNAYLAGFCPITALTRVLEWNAFEWLMRRQYDKLNSRESESTCRALAGAILGEFVCATDNQAPIENTPIQAFAATACFALAKCVAISCSHEEAALALYKWLKLKTQFRAHDSARDPEIATILLVASAIIGNTAFIPFQNLKQHSAEELATVSKLARAVMMRSDISHQLSSLTNGSIDWATMSEVSNQNREWRVTWYEKLSKDPNLQQLPSTLKSFIFGYLISLIGDGSFDHYRYVHRTTTKDPSAIIWYGFCAGANESRLLLTSFGGLARRILRELDNQLHTESRRPQSDISFEELLVIARETEQAPNIRRFSKNSLRVELIPGVSTYIRAFPGDAPASSVLASPILKLLDELNWNVERVNEVMAQIRQLSNEASSYPRKATSTRRR